MDNYRGRILASRTRPPNPLLPGLQQNPLVAQGGYLGKCPSLAIARKSMKGAGMSGARTVDDDALAGVIAAVRATSALLQPARVDILLTQGVGAGGRGVRTHLD